MEKLTEKSVFWPFTNFKKKEVEPFTQIEAYAQYQYINSVYKS